MAIKYRKQLRESKKFIKELEYRIMLLETAVDRTQQLEFNQWYKERNRRLPIAKVRIQLTRKAIYLEGLKNTIQKQIDEYQKESSIKIISDCYPVIDRGTVNVFIHIKGTVKEKLFFSYPFEGVNYFDSSEFIGKTLDEAEIIKNTTLILSKRRINQ